MELLGHIQNGVVVLDDGATFPEGTRVSVSAVSSLLEPKQSRIKLPLVRTGSPGTLNLTNEIIAQIFEDEDIEMMKRMWNEPS